MKVTFIFSGLPHYLTALLNDLVRSHGVEVSVIIPEERGTSLGDGIKLEGKEESCLFSVHRLSEFRGKLNKPYLRDLHRSLAVISPHILVIAWPYILNFYFDAQARKTCRSKNISLVFREIPFMVAPKNQALGHYRKHPVFNENLEVDNPRGLKFIPWAIALNQMRIRYYKLADATMIYASHGFEVQESFGLSREKIFLTYNSPDTAKIADTRRKLLEKGAGTVHPKRILHLGRLVKWKRVDLLIEAVSLLSAKHQDIELHIIGTGPEESDLKQMVRQRALEGRVKFLGGIYDPEDLGREIMASSIYALAGMGGLSINEAMAYGKPVICSRCDGTERDLVIDGENGLYFQEGNAGDLASKIGILLDDPEQCRLMGEQSLTHIEQKINLEIVSQRFMDCFTYLYRS